MNTTIGLKAMPQPFQEQQAPLQAILSCDASFQRGFTPDVFSFYVALLRSVFKDPAIQKELNPHLRLSSEAQSSIAIEIIDFPASGGSRYTAKAKIAQPGQGEEFFAVKFSKIYDATSEESIFSEKQISDILGDRPFFRQHYSRMLACKQYVNESPTGAVEEYRNLTKSDESNPKWHGFVHIDSWVDGLTIGNLVKKITEGTSPLSEQESCLSTLMDRTIDIIIEGWSQLHSNGEGLLYDTGIDDIMIRFSESGDMPLECLAMHGDVVFIDPDGGSRCGAVDKLIVAIETWNSSLEHLISLTNSSILPDLISTHKATTQEKLKLLQSY